MATEVISADGRLVASASNDRTVRLFHADGSGEVKIAGHDAIVWGVAFSPDGHLYSAGEDATLREWDVETGAALRTAKAAAELGYLAIAPDGLVALSGEPAASERWDLRTMASLGVIRSTSNNVWSVAVSPDGRLAATGDSHGQIVLHDLISGTEHEAPGHEGIVRWLSVSRDGQLLASTASDLVRVWRFMVDDSRAIALPAPAGLSAAGASALALATSQGVLVVDLATGATRTLTGATGALDYLGLTPDGRRVVATGEDLDVHLWDVASGAHEVLTRVGRRGGGTWANYGMQILSADGRFAVVRDGDRALVTIDLETRATCRFEGRWMVNAAFGDHGVLAYMDGHEVWRAQLQGCATQRVYDHTTTEYLYTIGISPDGARLAAAGADGRVSLWNAEDGVRILEGHSGQVDSVLFSPDGALLASQAADGIVRLWDARTGAPRQILHNHAAGRITLRFSSGGRLLATMDTARTIRVWELGSGDLRVIRNRTGVASMAFTPSGDEIVTVGTELRIYSTASSELVPRDPARLRAWLATATTARIDSSGRLAAP
jgi:WD40 repeat protein